MTGARKGGGGETHLDLVHLRRPDVARLPELLDLGDAKVAHADGPRAALAAQPLERLPRGGALLGPAARGVDEEEVHVAASAGAGAGVVDLVDALQAGAVVLVGRARHLEDLGGDEDVGAGEAGLAEGLADLGLVLVVLGSVDVAVARLEGGEAGGEGAGRGREVGAQAELGDLDRGGSRGGGGVGAARGGLGEEGQGVANLAF